MSHTVIALNQRIFKRLLKHAPPKLREVAAADAERVVLGLCFTEQDIAEHCESDERWEWLTEKEKAAAIACLLVSRAYEHVTQGANEAIEQAVDRYLDDTAGSHPAPPGL